jgi:hypothetical protein
MQFRANSQLLTPRCASELWFPLAFWQQSPADAGLEDWDKRAPVPLKRVGSLSGGGRT